MRSAKSKILKIWDQLTGRIGGIFGDIAGEGPDGYKPLNEEGGEKEENINSLETLMFMNQMVSRQNQAMPLMVEDEILGSFNTIKFDEGSQEENYKNQMIQSMFNVGKVNENTKENS